MQVLVLSNITSTAASMAIGAALPSVALANMVSLKTFGGATSMQQACS